MPNPAAQTAYGPMSVVATEQSYPASQRLVQDELAIQFLPPGLQVFARLTRWPPLRTWLFNLSEKNGRGVWAGVLCRKRYIADRLREALEAGFQTVVILGAGLDTCAYRLGTPSPPRVFEVDLPENSAYKRARLQAVFGGVPAHVTLTPLDFDNQDLAQALAAAGYRNECQSFFIWEAVTQYLHATGVRQTLSCLAQAGRGSRLVFTYVRRDFIEGTNRYGLDSLYEVYCVKRPWWRFGLMPREVAPLLAEYGWQEVEQLGGEEFNRRYLQPAGRTMPVMEIERIVYAEKR